MFKLFATLARGRAAAAVEEMVDRDALLLLDQQVRDAGAALARAKRALALATAQDTEETRRLDGVAARLADLEERARQALAAERLDLATEAAEAIAALEADGAAGRQARGARRMRGPSRRQPEPPDRPRISRSPARRPRRAAAIGDARSRAARPRAGH